MLKNGARAKVGGLLNVPNHQKPDPVSNHSTESTLEQKTVQNLTA
jgi:hypothetical protein